MRPSSVRSTLTFSVSPPQQTRAGKRRGDQRLHRVCKERSGSVERRGRLGILRALTERVHPLVLGEVYRSRAQIRMLGRRLIKRQLTDEGRVDKVLDFLCSESGSHDYTIYRQEARDELGLKVERPDDALYATIRDIYRSYS